MATFYQWNDALLRYFFEDVAPNAPVWFEVSSDLLDVEFQKLGGRKGFLAALLAGPEWMVGRDEVGPFFPPTFRERALGLKTQWFMDEHRRNQAEYREAWRNGPPFLPYLAVQCLAWSDEEAANGNAFYVRLGELYPNHGVTNQLNELHGLWQGARTWCSRQNGVCGSFSIVPFGQPYVGIPRAHVVFTPEIRGRLPKLFSLIGEPTRESIDTAYCDQVLGPSLSNKTRDPTDQFGIYALERLRSEYESWDGVYEVENDDHDAGGGDGGAQAPAFGPRARLFVCARDSDGIWESGVVLSGGLMAGNYSLSEAETLYTAEFCEGSSSTPFESEAGVWLQGNLVLERESVTKTLEATDDENGSWTVTASSRAKCIRILTKDFAAMAYVERDTRPGFGEMYAIVHPDVSPNWMAWLKDYDIFANPLGRLSSWALFRISDVENISERAWAYFPDGGRPGGPRKAEPIRLVGGTRAKRSGAVSTYLAQDPPVAVLEWPVEGSVGVTGADFTAPVHDVVPGVEQPLVLEPCVDHGIVEINLFSNATLVKRKRFAVKRSTEFYGGNHFVDRFGVVTPLEEAGRRWWTDWPLGEPAAIPFDYLPKAPCAPYPRLDDYQDVPNKFGHAIDILELLSQSRRKPFSRLRDWITSRRKRYHVSSAIKELAWLGHVDIETDSEGRWTYVRAVPPTFYRLPVGDAGSWSFALCGTWNRAFFVALVAAASQRTDVTLDVRQSSPRAATPPRVVLTGSLSDVKEVVASAAGAGCVPVLVTESCLAERLVAYAAPSSEWQQRPAYALERTLQEMHLTRSYKPQMFITSSGIASDFARLSSQLGMAPDRVANRQERSYLVTRTNVEGVFSFRDVDDRAYAKWFAHVDRMRYFWNRAGLPGNPEIPIPFERLFSAIHVPKELAPPIVIGRALAMATGFAPSTKLSTVYSSSEPQQCPYTPDWKPYFGHCLHFYGVPEQLATQIANKLGVVLRNV